MYHDNEDGRSDMQDGDACSICLADHALGATVEPPTKLCQSH